MDEQRVGLFLRLLGAGERATLSTVLRIMHRILERDFRLAQALEADAQARAALAARTLQALRAAPDVRAADPVDPVVLADQLRPWLGEEAMNGDLPVPALIDVLLTPGEAGPKIDRLRRLLADLSPKLRIEPHAAFLTPLAGLLSALGWLALGAVLLMMLATAAVVVLAARGAHDSHRGTIDVLHLMGSTDVQIARLFQRRIGLDALMGGALGFSFGIFVILLIGLRLGATGSELLAAITLPWQGWLILVALPVAGVLLATLTARWTVLRALGRTL